MFVSSDLLGKCAFGMGHLGRQRFIGLGDRCRHRKARVRSCTSPRPAIHRSQTGVPLSESTHPEWAISATSNLPVVWDRCCCRKGPRWNAAFPRRPSWPDSQPERIRPFDVRIHEVTAGKHCGLIHVATGPPVNMRGHSKGSPACWLSALFQHQFWTFGRSFNASDAEQPKVCCDQHGQKNRCYVPQVSVRRATHSFRDGNFRCRGCEAHHGGLTYAALDAGPVTEQNAILAMDGRSNSARSGGV
jgi:hypothetical protein